MSPVFADTSFYAAIVNRRDQLHARAMEAAAKIDGPILSSEFVLLETANFCTVGQSRAVFLRLVANLRAAPKVEIVPATAAGFQRGLDLFAVRPIQIMGERGIADALTADKHFEQAGFVALLR
jgi:uncharacterized protein